MACEWQIENDPNCIEVLEAHWPNTKRYGDIRKVDPTELKPIDVIAGGFPCQDVSDAGRKAGLSGARSGLWKEYRRIICHLRPRVIIVENVAGLLGRGMGDILSDLSQIGYDAEWQTIPAAAFGAPHRRNRVFIVAYSNGIGFDKIEVFNRSAFEKGIQKSQVGPWRDWRPAISNSNRIFKIPNGGILSMVDGVPGELAGTEIRMIGNAVVPEVMKWIGKRVIEEVLNP